MPDTSDAVSELTRLSEELGLYNMSPEACMTHLRFVPCRKDGPHRYSSDPADVAAVREVHALLPSYRDELAGERERAQGQDTAAG